VTTVLGGAIEAPPPAAPVVEAATIEIDPAPAPAPMALSAPTPASTFKKPHHRVVARGASRTVTKAPATPRRAGQLDPDGTVDPYQ
jgi:hypothetical protein